MSTGPRFHIFFGQGGSGKTTLAAARALELQNRAPSERILICTSEKGGGALADTFKKAIGSKPTKLAPSKSKEGGLWGLSIEADQLEAAIAIVRTGFEEIAAKGRTLSEDEVRRLLQIPFLGPEESGLLLALGDLLQSGAWDRIVLDGPSSSHALRLTDALLRLRRLVDVARGHRSSRALKATGKIPTQADPLAERLDAAIALIRDSGKSEIVVVTVAEPVAEGQTKWLLKGLHERGVQVANLVVNMIEDGKSSRETSNRRGLQAPHVRKYQSLHPRVQLLRRAVTGPKGVDGLRAFAELWASNRETKALAFLPAESPPALVRAPSMPPVAAPAIPPTRFIFFVGSGGTGKTTCAAAAAVTLTEKEGPVLLLSADPGHTLADVVLGRLTDTETQVRGTKGLYAREFDFAGFEANFRKKLKEAVDSWIGPESRGDPFAVDRTLLRQLAELAPSQLDEWGPIVALTDAYSAERFKRIVVDLPPSLHSVRLLETLAIARTYFATLESVFHRHRSKGSGPLLSFVGSQLAVLDKFEKAITNEVECRFFVVTRAEELTLPAAARLGEYLKGRRNSIERAIVNRILPKTSCPVTEERRKHELEVARSAEKKLGLPITLAPALGRHPAGLRELKGFRTSWYAVSAILKNTRAA